jgi:hypothetical protein
MKLSQLIAHVTYQPSDSPSGPATVTVTPNAGDATFTARLMVTAGSPIMATFANGTLSPDGRTFTFNSLQPGPNLILVENRSVSLSGGTLTLTLEKALSPAAGMGNVSGSMTLDGAAFDARAVAQARRAGRPLPSADAGVAVKLSAQMSGTYIASLVPKTDAAPAGQSQIAPAPPAVIGPKSEAARQGPAVPPAGACADGCQSTIGALKVVARYQYPHATYPSLNCEEKVYRFPADWPGGPFLHAIVCNGPNPRGAPVTLINFKLAKTDRAKDQDTVILYTDVGAGSFRGPDGRLWRVKIFGPSTVESMTIELAPR